MEGLETLVTPSHHAYLLTESAAAAHFNVLSFDTCSLFKTAATTASSYNLNNNNHATTNNNHHSHQQTQLLSSHHHHQQHHQQSQQQMQQPTVQQNQQQQQTISANTSNSSNTSSHSATSVTQSKSDSTVVSSSTVTTTTSSSGHHNHPTINIQETQQQTADRNVQHQQTGDLNTPVTTSGDIPSFFGPSTVVEPPIITGKFLSPSTVLILINCFRLGGATRITFSEGKLYSTISCTINVKLMNLTVKLDKFSAFFFFSHLASRSLRPSDLKHRNPIYIQSINTVGDSIDSKIGEKEKKLIWKYYYIELKQARVF